MSSPIESARTSVFVKIGDYAARKKGFVFAVTALLVFLAVSLGTRLRLDTDILDMVPKDNAKVKAFRSSLEEFGGIDYLVVLIETPEGREGDDYHEFVDAFAARLQALPDVISVEYRLGANEALLDLFRKYALLLLPPAELPDLERRLSHRGIRAAVADDMRILASPSGAVLKDLVRHDPLGIGRMIGSRLIGGSQGLRLNPIDGYYMSEDGSALLMLVKPKRPAQDLKFTADFVARVKQSEENARKEVAEDGLDLGDLKVEYGGSYIITLVDSNLIRGDLKLTAVCSFLGVILVYLIGYRRFAALFYSSIPLIVGQALTFALAAIVLGRLNSASSGFVAMLMGLGTDFTIIMYARYVEARQDGMEVRPSIERMMSEAGLGVFTGAITSAGTFYALCTTEFLGLRELGILIGSGMLFCLISIFLLLPAMISWNEGGKRKLRPPAKLHVQSFGIEHLAPIAVRHRKLTITVTVIMAIWLGIEGWNISFSDSVQNLRSPDNEGAVVAEKVAKKFGGNLNVMMAIIETPDVESALERMEHVVAAAQPYVGQKIINGTDSLLRYLPSEPDQRRVIQALREGSESPDGPFSPVRIERQLRAELSSQGFNPAAFDAYYPELRSMLEVSEPVGVEDLQGQALSSLLGRYIKKTDGGYRSAVYLYMDRDRWRREAPPGLAEALSGGDPSVVVTGVNVVSKELRTIFGRDAKKAVIIGFILVTILLALDLRSFKMAMLANAQVIMGILTMFGVMSLFDIQLNFVNSFTAIMVLGFGVDYGIHMIHRLRASGGVVDRGVLETGKAITMAALTNGAGFGSLMLSNYPAMKSVGVVAILGSIGCLLAALTFVPAVLAARPEEAAAAEKDTGAREPAAPEAGKA